MIRHILLTSNDIHCPGDEMWDGVKDRWIPVPPVHFGDRVQEPGCKHAMPCRRPLYEFNPKPTPEKP